MYRDQAPRSEPGFFLAPAVMAEELSPDREPGLDSLEVAVWVAFQVCLQEADHPRTLYSVTW